MTNGFVELTDTDALDHFLAESTNHPVIIFKHSSSCGISARAYREMAGVEQPVGIITVQEARPVSQEIERRFGIAHETPQVLILRKSEVIWTASHGQVKAEAVEAAVKAVSSKQKE